MQSFAATGFPIVVAATNEKRSGDRTDEIFSRQDTKSLQSSQTDDELSVGRKNVSHEPPTAGISEYGVIEGEQRRPELLWSGKEYSIW